MAQADPFGRKPVDQPEHSVQRLEQRRVICKIGADVAVDADHFDLRQAGRFAVQLECGIERDAEFAFFQAGRT